MHLHVCMYVYVYMLGLYCVFIVCLYVRYILCVIIVCLWIYSYLYILLFFYITSYTFIDYSNNIINICRVFIIVIIIVNIIIVAIIFFIVIIITFYIFFSFLLSSPIQCLFIYFTFTLALFFTISSGNASSETVNNIR